MRFLVKFVLSAIFSFLLAILSASFAGGLLAFCHFFSLSAFGTACEISLTTVVTIWALTAIVVLVKLWADIR